MNRQAHTPNDGIRSRVKREHAATIAANRKRAAEIMRAMGKGTVRDVK